MISVCLQAAEKLGQIIRFWVAPRFTTCGEMQFVNVLKGRGFKPRR
jgi:hypothetical protein